VGTHLAMPRERPKYNLKMMQGIIGTASGHRNLAQQAVRPWVIRPSNQHFPGLGFSRSKVPSVEESDSIFKPAIYYRPVTPACVTTMYLHVFIVFHIIQSILQVSIAALNCLSMNTAKVYA
jgi:hypothetical protein